MFSFILKVINALRFRLTRLLNQKHRYDYKSENIGWKKYSYNPVYGDFSTRSVFDPFVFLDGQIFKMLVSERRHNCIVLLESKDGINWGKQMTILKCIPNTWQSFVNRASLVCVDGLWHMWYTGQSPDVACIGHTTSKVVLSFKNSNEPCLTAELPQEGVSVMNPHVIWNDQRKIFQMWYAAGENYEPDVLFYAESKDGDNWVKHPQPVLTKLMSHPWECAKVGGCDVKLLTDGTYEMYYIGYQNVDVARICYATSDDGIHWHRTDENLLISPTKGAFDADATYKPSVIEKCGKRYMWYNGRCKDEEYIGLATKQ